MTADGGIDVVDNGANDIEEWTRPLWVPIEAGGPLAADATTYAYTTVEEEGRAVIQPTEALAPIPAGVASCTPLVRGCRALRFKYDTTETTATGENPSQWGEYKGHLSKVVFHAYNPASKTMEEPTVAQYVYDKQGRLRAEWDPRLEHPLKTVYGYDAEGHVTALTSAGQQPWAFTYGTSAGDANTGRLLKVTRAQPKGGASEEEVKAKLKEQQEQPSNTAAAKLSGSTVVGVTMGVSNGTWSNSPFAYGYQWEDCNTEGKACTPILGATNANYKLATSDVGHTLLAQVWATNGGGTIIAASAASAVVTSSGTMVEGEHHSPGPGWSIDYHVPVSGAGLPTLSKEEVEKWGQKDTSEGEDNDPVEGTAIFPPDEPQGWPASDYTRARIDYMNNKGLSVNTTTPSGAVSTTEYNGTSEVTRTLSPGNRVSALKEGCISIAKKNANPRKPRNCSTPKPNTTPKTMRSSRSSAPNTKLSSRTDRKSRRAA